MPRGGPRIGAGRPRKSADKAKSTVKKPRKVKLMPLEYMLEVINDDGADPSRRDRMAAAAAPYVHAKVEAGGGGKKEQRQANAEAASSQGMYATPTGPKLVVANK